MTKQDTENLREEADHLFKRIGKMVRKYDPNAAITSLLAVITFILDHSILVKSKRECYLRLSRHFLDLSKEYKDERKESIEE